MTFIGSVFICSNCSAEFSSDPALREHKRITHNPMSQYLRGERPVNRGPVACGHPGCEHSFANEKNAEQHRRHKHGAQT
jgi:hypothetical protein